MGVSMDIKFRKKETSLLKLKKYIVFLMGLLYLKQIIAASEFWKKVDTGEVKHL